MMYVVVTIWEMLFVVIFVFVVVVVLVVFNRLKKNVFLIFWFCFISTTVLDWMKLQSFFLFFKVGLRHISGFWVGKLGSDFFICLILRLAAGKVQVLIVG
jgi:hypothetical protein